MVGCVYAEKSLPKIVLSVSWYSFLRFGYAERTRKETVTFRDLFSVLCTEKPFTYVLGTDVASLSLPVWDETQEKTAASGLFYSEEFFTKKPLYLSGIVFSLGRNSHSEKGAERYAGKMFRQVPFAGLNIQSENSINWESVKSIKRTGPSLLTIIAPLSDIF